jgi:telomerase protein component 1
MATAWKTTRVFISSTFRDMHAERDWLVKRVFPALRQRLEPLRIHLVDIDLRWGITREQADNDQVLGLCLQQIDECRPFFLGLLGGRYGWVPARLPADVGSRFGWTQYHAGKSITELEIVHGVLNDPATQRRALFCFRGDQFLDGIDSVHRAIYEEQATDEDTTALGRDEAERRAAERRGQLADLKNQIRKLSPPLRLLDGYSCTWDATAINPASKVPGRIGGLGPFGAWVVAHLERVILDAPEMREHLAAVRHLRLDDLAEEREHHQRFIESRTRVYVGRQRVEDALAAFAGGEDAGPCLVAGPSGCGKSASLAKFVTFWRDTHPRDAVIAHFVGASSRAAGLREMLRHLCAEVADTLHRRVALKDDVRDLSEQFRDLLDRVPANRRVVLVIDALDQLGEGDAAHALYWLPVHAPPQVRVVISCIDDPDRPAQPVLQAVRGRHPHEIPVAPLDDQERLSILREAASVSAKTLDQQQLAMLLGNEATRNPLFLQTALEELRGFGSFEQLNRRIAAFPREGDTLTALFQQVIRRLAEDFDPDAVTDVLSLLTCARRGLSERELLDLTEGEQVGVDTSMGDLFPILRQIRPFLQSRGPLLDFFHRHFAQAVRNECFPEGTGAWRPTHQRLASYFRRKADPDPSARWACASPRPFGELPFQLILSGPPRDELESVLTDIEFVAAGCATGLTFDLVADYQAALREWGTDAPAPGAVRAFANFLSQHADILARDPSQVLALARNHAAGGPVVRDADRVLERRRWADHPWIELRDRLPFIERPALLHTLGGHRADVAAVALSDDGRCGISGSMDGTFRVWRLPVGVCERVVTAHPAGINGVAMTPDGAVAATAGADGLVKFWRVETGDCIVTLTAEPIGCLCVALTADASLACTGGLDGTIGVWDVKTGERLHALRGHFGPVSSLALSADGGTLVSGSWDCAVRVWSTDDWSQRACLLGHDVPVQGVSVDASGSVVASCSGLPPDADGRVSYRQLDASDVRLWRGGEEIRRLTPHETRSRGGLSLGVLGSVIHAVSLSRDGDRVVSAGYDHTVSAGGRTLSGHTDSVHAVALDAAGTTAITGGCDRTVRVWDLAGQTAPLRTVFAIGRVGCGRRASPGVRASLLWRNTRVRLMLFLPAVSMLVAWLVTPWLGALVGMPRPAVSVMLAQAAAIFTLVGMAEWRAVLKLDTHAWQQPILPGVFWTVVGLLLLPLWPLFPVLDCPRCGERLSGRRRLFYCPSCGFRDGIVKRARGKS